MTTRVLSTFALCTLIVLTPSCAHKAEAVAFSIGQKVQVGKLFYQVVDAQWRTEVGGLKTPTKDRILQVHFTVTNSGAEEISIPFLRLLDASGKEIAELTEIDGNSKWMGPIRRLQPSLTEEGYIYFDVPVGSYRLEVVDNSVADSEKSALVEIPASLAPPPALPGASGI